jgi:uncharacterized sporulation protein YeaH/YhbH (DUF444 family)
MKTKTQTTMNPDPATVLTQNLRTLLHGPDDPAIAVKMRDMIDARLKEAEKVTLEKVNALVTPILKISGALDESDVEMHSHLVVKLWALLNSRQNVNVEASAPTPISDTLKPKQPR